MNVNLQPREGSRPQVKDSEPDKFVDKPGGKKERPDKGKKGGGKSGGAPEATGGFKPVGD